MNYARGIAVALLLAAVFGAGWGVNGWRLGVGIAQTEAAHQKAIAQAAGEVLRVQGERDTVAATLRSTLAGIDRDESDKLTKAQNELENLRSAVNARSVRLRVNATCPPIAGVVPSPGAGGSVDTPAAAALTPAAESGYFALRKQIAGTEATLRACQGALGVLTGQPAS